MGQINDDEYAFLVSQGIPPTHINDMRHEYLFPDYPITPDVFIDNRLTSGLNDGSSPENAFRSIGDLTAASINAAGGTVGFARGSGPYRELLDTKKNGTVGNPIIWYGNGVEVSSGMDMNDSAYKWTKSATGNKWYVEAFAGGDPLLTQVKSGSVNGWAWISATDDSDHQTAVPGSLSLHTQIGWGDDDTLGYSTLYIWLDSGVPADYEVIVSQANYVYSINWANHDFYDFRLSHGNTGVVYVAGLNINLYRSLIAYGDFSGVRTSGNGSSGNELITKLHNCIFYWTGHRGLQIDANFTEIEYYNCIDYSSHLSLWAIGTIDATAIVDMQGFISENGEAGGCDIRSPTMTFTESNNCWHPRMTAPSGALGYLSTANWPTTHATDLPPSHSTTETNQANLVDPQFIKTSDFGFDRCNFKLKSTSPCIALGIGVLEFGLATLPR